MNRYWQLVLILLFAALLFSEGIATLPLWTDEGYSVLASQQPDLLNFVERDVHPPLFLYILRGWEPLAGGSLFALRLPGLLISLISVALVYRLALDWFDQRAAVVAALIFTTSDLVIGLAAVARHYNLYVLLTILSILLYDRYTRHWQPRWGLAYILAGAALLYTLYWGALILIAQGIHFLIYHPRRLPWIAVPALLIGLLFLPWLPKMLNVAQGAGVDIHDGGHTTSLPLNEEGFRILFYQLAGIPEPLFIGLGLAGIAGSWQGRRCLPTRPTALLACWLLAPLLLAIVLTATGYDLLVHRPAVGLIPAMALLIGHVFRQLPPWQTVVLTTIILINNLTTLGANYQQRQPWWAMADLMQRYSAPTDALAIEANIDAYAMAYHFELADVPAQTILRNNAIRNAWDNQAETDVNAMLNDHPAVWLVEYIARHDLRFDLIAMGYVPTTPTIQLEAPVPLSNEPIRMVRYARLPDQPALTTFGEHLALREADVFQHQEQIAVDLLWQPTRAPGIDYTVSVFLLNEAGQLVRQHDSYPLEGRSPTSTWQPDSTYFDRHWLDRQALPAGNYTIAVKIYTWWDQQVYPPANCPATPCDYWTLTTLRLE